MGSTTPWVVASLVIAVPVGSMSRLDVLSRATKDARKLGPEATLREVIALAPVADFPPPFEAQPVGDFLIAEGCEISNQRIPSSHTLGINYRQ
jgi:hypothetical protein